MATKIMATKTKETVNITDLQFRQMPSDGGQIAEVSYACDECWLYRHTFDRSDRSERYERVGISARNKHEFEPQNGLLPTTSGKWQTIDVVSDDDDSDE